ncbi:AfsR/SARP family transcriptional regulator [Anaerosolibacter sp.]|uniref:AfsR/SARP family transcriptional regulator n=1 Tax=Anaerosolibacter sp. TaxID=1872527 RepID=UPI0039EF1291
MKLKISMLGNPEVTVDDSTITDQLSQKALGILCYLAKNLEKPISRDKLACLFWDESNIETAKYNLRYNLWSLRKALEDDKKKSQLIITQKETCMLNTSCNIYIDVFEAEKITGTIGKNEETVSLDHLERVNEIYKGDFLEGFYIKGCAEFNDWVFYERERLQRKYFDVLHRLVEIYKGNKEFLKCIDILERMLRVNPLQEETYVELIRIYLASGDRNAALNQYKRCCNTLREELNVGPMESTKMVYQEILKYDERCNRISKPQKERPAGEQKIDIMYLKSNLEMEIQQKTEDNARSIINTCCYPIADLQYYWVVNFLKEVLAKYDKEILKKVPLYYWRDMLRLDGSVQKIFNNIGSPHILTEEIEKNRIFSALEALIITISTEKPIWIYIRDLHLMDKTSFDSLKYLLFQNRQGHITLIISGDENDEKILQLRKYFDIKEG